VGAIEQYPHDLGYPPPPDELGGLLEALAHCAFRLHADIVSAQFSFEAEEY
jgi:hypothetical protein